jgi:hypothetical protein
MLANPCKFFMTDGSNSNVGARGGSPRRVRSYCDGVAAT